MFLFCFSFFSLKSETFTITTSYWCFDNWGPEPGGCVIAARLRQSNQRLLWNYSWAAIRPIRRTYANLLGIKNIQMVRF